MSYVSSICISKQSGTLMKETKKAKLVSGKGIINDRYFNDNNNKDIQITLIESENIDHFNKISGTNIPYIEFRRNIITKGIKLNSLVGKEFFIGNIKIKGHRLCDPCKYLQEILKQKNLVKNLLNRGGLRCEILSDGKISVKDEIKLV